MTLREAEGAEPIQIAQDKKTSTIRAFPMAVILQHTLNTHILGQMPLLQFGNLAEPHSINVIWEV